MESHILKRLRYLLEIFTFGPVREKTNNLGSDLVWHKPGCTVTEEGQKLEISDLGRRGIILSVWRKQRRWSASRFTAKLFCVFVFAYADCWFFPSGGSFGPVLWHMILKIFLHRTHQAGPCPTPQLRPLKIFHQLVNSLSQQGGWTLNALYVWIKRSVYHMMSLFSNG